MFIVFFNVIGSLYKKKITGTASVVLCALVQVNASFLKVRSRVVSNVLELPETSHVNYSWKNELKKILHLISPLSLLLQVHVCIPFRISRAVYAGGGAKFQIGNVS